MPRAITDPSLRAFPAEAPRWEIDFQPVVAWSERLVVGYSVAPQRGDHPGPATDDPLWRRALREAVASAAAEAPDQVFFVDLAPADLEDLSLYNPLGALSRGTSRVVLTLPEAATLCRQPSVRRRLARLRSLGFQLALGGLASGGSALAALLDLEPDLVRIDAPLVRGVHTSAHGSPARWLAR